MNNYFINIIFDLVFSPRLHAVIRALFGEKRSLMYSGVQDQYDISRIFENNNLHL